MKTIRVAAAVIMRRGEVLICDRPPEKPPAGWEFPGGKLEPGETPVECLKRELREELALEVTVFDQLYQVEHRQADRVIRLHFIRCLLPETATPRPQERQHCRWVRLAELPEAGLLEPDRPVAEFLAAERV